MFCRTVHKAGLEPPLTPRQNRHRAIDSSDPRPYKPRTFGKDAPAASIRAMNQRFCSDANPKKGRTPRY
jgi:hypothetical protein